MREITYVDPRVDRSKWSSGAWDGEPDKVQWTDEATGFACLAKRNPMLGHWCGYVGVEPSHPWHGRQFDTIEAAVHGGLTYSSGCDHGPVEESICHVPEPGRPDDVWWLGFDCAHAWDSSPGMVGILGIPEWMQGVPTAYKSLDYVREQCAELARQCKEQA